MKNFSIKNPLSIIAVFSTITEGLCIYGLPKITEENQELFIWFIICFPTILILFFFITLNFNHKVLYSPSDFIGVNKSTSKNFLKGKNYKGGLQEKISTTKIPTTTKSAQTSSHIDKYLSNSSIIGIFALYAISLSKNKTFNIYELGKKIQLLNGDYTIGYLISSSSFGLFSRKNYSEDWQVGEIDVELSEKIEQAVFNKIIDEQKAGNYLEKEKKAIEKFFNALPITAVLQDG